MMDKEKIKALALANGFKLKEQADGSMDLNPYVYQFAAALERLATAELKAQVEQLNVLIIKMQERATLFLQPDGESESEFVNFIIGILDGPEQRLAQSTPAQCLAEIKAQAVEQVFNHFKNKFNGSEKLTVRDICWMLDEHLNQLRQQAKGAE